MELFVFIIQNLHKNYLHSSISLNCSKLCITLYFGLSTLLSLSINKTSNPLPLFYHKTNKKPRKFLGYFQSGVPEGIRTPDRCLRRALLYPAELLRQSVPKEQTNYTIKY